MRRVSAASMGVCGWYDCDARSGLTEDLDMAPLERKLGNRFWLEAVLASVTGALCLATLFWHDWLEAFGFDPDHHNGTVEWFNVAVLFVVTLALAAGARIEWRRAAAAQ
jgi:hypothetical protein